MTLREIAVKNLMRRRGKAALVLAGLVIGVSTVIAIISFVESMASDIGHKLEKYGANIVIVPKAENLPLSYGGISLGGVALDLQEIRQDQLARIDTIQNARNIAAVGPVLLGAVQYGTRHVLLAGVDFKAAEILKPWWQLQGMIPKADDLLLGAEAARILGLHAGDHAEINGRNFYISKILHPTGSQDDHLIFTHLNTAQALLQKPGKITMAEAAALCQGCPIDDIVRQISAVLPDTKVMAIQQVVSSRMETLSHFKTFAYAISIVVVLVGSLVVLVTMLGSVRERTEEIGIFRAIGFRKSHVVRIVLIEAGIISILAGILGYLGGLAGAKIALMFFAENAGHGLYLNLPMAAGALGLALLTGLLSSIYPALLAARMDPNEALRAM